MERKTEMKTAVMIAILLMAMALMVYRPINKAEGLVNSSTTKKLRGKTFSLLSSPPTEWNKTYGGANGDLAYSVIQTNDGGYALAGYTASFGAVLIDFWLVKTDSAGNLVWSQTYGGANFDEAYSMIQTSDGGYALAGYTESFGAGAADFWLVKTDSAGNLVWSRTYGGANGDVAYSVIQTSDGGYALACMTASFGAGWSDFWLVKTDSTGNMIWSQTYGGANDDVAYSVIQTNDGGYALAGFTKSFGAGGQDFWLVKVAPEVQYEHDVIVTDIVLSKTVVGQGYSLNINVTAANQGEYTETFNVTLYANTTEIETREITLTNGTSTTLTFTWNTTGFAKGNYTIWAYAWPVSGETDIGDNTYSDGIVTIAMIGDLTGPNGYPDGKCDMRDVSLVARCFGQTVPPAPPNCDITGSIIGVPDGKIDMKDISTVARHFGETDP